MGNADVEGEGDRGLGRLVGSFDIAGQLIDGKGVEALVGQPLHLLEEPAGLHCHAVEVEARVVVFDDR